MTAPASVMPTPVDLDMLDDLYALGAATTPVVLLLRRSHSPDATGGLANHRRRLTALHNDGTLSRFADRFGMVLGSRAYIYAVESGTAGLAAATRRHYDDIPEDVWREIRKRAAGTRERLTELLVQRGHGASAVRARLDQLSSLCLKYYAGETTFRHKLLGATAAGVLWLGARAQGLEVHTVRPDGALALSVPGASGPTAVVKPDLFFGLGTMAVFLEAETGTASRAKVTAKLLQYASLLNTDILAPVAAISRVTFTEARLLMHCGTNPHAQMVADIASTLSPRLQEVIRITGPSDLTTDSAGDDPLMVNDIVSNVRIASGETVLDHFTSRINAPIFAAVNGRDSLGARLHCTSFLGRTS